MHSAIGRSTALISQELIKQGNHLTIVRTEDSQFIKNSTHDFGIQPISWEDFSNVANQIKNADSCIYEIGDYYPFHKGALTWLKFKPGIICLHDYTLANLFHEWARRHPYEAVAEYNYFDIPVADFKKQFYRAQDGKKQIEYVSRLDENFPSAQWICKKGNGVIVHSSWGIDKVIPSCSGPVYVIPLAYNLIKSIDQPTIQKNLKEKKSFSLLTFGHINRNKRVLEVIEAIGNSALAKEHFTYHLAGQITPLAMTEALMRSKINGVSSIIYGQVSDRDLLHRISDADLVSCLRWPTTEAASASCIETMLSGTPILVSNTGFYKEIPDEFVFKIDPKNEIEDLTLALESFIQNPQEFRVRAKKAQIWAQKIFSANNYVEQLKLIIKDVKANDPVVQAINLLKAELKLWAPDQYVDDVIKNMPNLEIFEFT
jgi:glycosyltransferase involved in cell wall biosynthesis